MGFVRSIVRMLSMSIKFSFQSSLYHYLCKQYITSEYKKQAKNDFTEICIGSGSAFALDTSARFKTRRVCVSILLLVQRFFRSYTRILFRISPRAQRDSDWNSEAIWTPLTDALFLSHSYFLASHHLWFRSILIFVFLYKIIPSSLIISFGVPNIQRDRWEVTI